MRHLLLILMSLLPYGAYAVELRHELGEDQRSETLTVAIDGRTVGTLSVDRKRPKASLALALPRDQHRYRLSGEAVMDDGTRIAIAGAGLILRAAAMNRIGEAESALKAIAAFEEVLTELHKAAPEFSLDPLRVQRSAPASKAGVVAAERRLGRALPQGYRDFVLKHGSLHIGSAQQPGARVFAPDEVQTLEEFVLQKARENENQPEHVEEMRRFIGKRFPAARRDMVLDVWENEYPSVVRAGKRCPGSEIPYAFPESQWEVLMGSHLEDNPFVALINYEDEIVGETSCMSFERQLAYSLHDQLYEAANNVLYLLGDDEDSIRLERGDLEEAQPRLWLRFHEDSD